MARNGDDSSNSDVEEKLLPGYSNDGPRSRNISSSKLTTYLRLAEHIAVAILIILLSFNLFQFSNTTTSSITSKDHRITSGPLLKTNITFGSDTRYMTLSHDFDYLWAPAMSPSYSEISLPPYDPHGHSLHPLRDEGAISMLHSLHCLAGIRHALQRAREGEDIGVDDRDDPHWPHCLHYLRQMVLCFADDTVELKRLANGTVAMGADIEGAWDLRTCRDSGKLFADYERFKIEGRGE